jgi:hypothetical protein
VKKLTCNFTDIAQTISFFALVILHIYYCIIFFSFFGFAGDERVLWKTIILIYHISGEVKSPLCFKFHCIDCCFDHNYMLVKVNEGVSEDGVAFLFINFFRMELKVANVVDQNMY